MFYDFFTTAYVGTIIIGQLEPMIQARRVIHLQHICAQQMFETNALYMYAFFCFCFAIYIRCSLEFTTSKLKGYTCYVKIQLHFHKAFHNFQCSKQRISLKFYHYIGYIFDIQFFQFNSEMVRYETSCSNDNRYYFKFMVVI